MKRLVVYLEDDLDDFVNRLAESMRTSRSTVGKLLIESALRQIDTIPIVFGAGNHSGLSTQASDAAPAAAPRK